MTTPQIINVTLENGLLRPDEALNLPPHTRLRLIVESTEDFRRPTQVELDEFDRYCDDNSVTSREPYLTRDERHDRR